MEELSRKQQILQEIKKHFISGASVVYLLTDEEDRVEVLLKELAATFQKKPKVFVWSPFQGMVAENERVENTSNPVDALEQVIQRPNQTFYVFEGLHTFLRTDPLVARKLKDVHRALRNRYATVFLVAPV